MISEEMFYGTLPQDTQSFDRVLQGIGRNVREFGRAAQYVPYDILGAPVDLATLAMRPFGYQTENPVGGSDWLINLARQMGVADKPTGSGSELAGRMAFGAVSPVAATKGLSQVGKFVDMIKSTPPVGSVNFTPQEVQAAQNAAQAFTQNKQNLETFIPQTKTINFKNWFGDWQETPQTASKVVDTQGVPLAVYHGTARPDRVGEQFRKSRATSGPMAFFTDDPSIASGYAKGKQDTSLAYEDTNYESWFKKKEGRSTLNLDQAGARMSQQERQQVLDKLRRIGQDDQGNIVLGEGLVSDSTFDFMLKDPREAGGNPLKLAKKLWLESGTLYGREEDFSKILNLAGVKGFDQDFPTASYPAVYKTFLNIRNPLDTASIDEYTMAQLEYVANRTRKAPQRGGADQWDKNLRDPKEWFRQLKEDYDAGQNSMVWTSIPDWVTKALKNIGYDGIKDSGGKFGGQGHTVWIPFEENQVKSATGNIGTFDPSKKSILRGAAAIPAGGLLGQDEE